MEKSPKNAKRAPGNGEKYRYLSKDRSDALKKLLGSNYYQEFERRFQKTHKGEKTPSFQTVSAALNGRTNNQKIMRIILVIAEEGEKLAQRLEEITQPAKASA